MNSKSFIAAALLSSCAVMPSLATRLMDVKVVDKDYLMLHFRDGEVRYRDDATGPSAYLSTSSAA